MITGTRVGTSTVAILLLASSAIARPPDTLWTRRYGGANDDCAYDLAIAADSGYNVVGDQGDYSGPKIWRLQTDRDGRLIGQTSYTPGGALAICRAEDNGSYYGGYVKYTYPESTRNAFVTRLGPDGGALWYQEVGDPDRRWNEYTRSIAATHDGGCVLAIDKVYMAGHVLLVRYSASGTLLWSRPHYLLAYWSVPYWVGQTPDRGFAVAGHSNGDVFLLRTDSLGDSLWCRKWGNQGGFNEERAYAACATRDSGFALFGYRESDTRRADFWLLRTDSAGETLWTRTYGNDGTEYGYGICEMPDGGFTLCGGRFFSGGTGIYLVRTDSLGDTLWTKTIPGSGLDCGYAVQPTPEGDLIVAGRLFNDAWLAKLNGQTGVAEQIWPAPVSALPTALVRGTLHRADESPADLVDATGRTVQRLRPGANDLGGIPAGVYVIRPLGTAPTGKVVVCQ